MAKNIIYPGHSINLTLPVPAGTASGNPVEIVDLHGVVLDDRDADGNATVKCPFAYVADLLVTAKNNSGNSAVAVGDKLYYDAAENPDELNKDSTAGKAFGYALETIGAGLSDTIKVGVAAL